MATADSTPARYDDELLVDGGLMATLEVFLHEARSQFLYCLVLIFAARVALLAAVSFAVARDLTSAQLGIARAVLAAVAAYALLDALTMLSRQRYTQRQIQRHVLKDRYP